MRMIFGRDHSLYLGFRALCGTRPGVSPGNHHDYEESRTVTRKGSLDTWDHLSDL